jgi:predicted phage tail protein
MGFANALAPAPSVPTAVRTERGVHAVTVRWQPPVNVAGSPIAGYTVTLDARSVLLPATARSFTFSGLSAGQPVRVSIRASNRSGTGNAIVRTTAAAAAPWAPASVRGTGRPGSVVLAWTPPTDDGGLAVTGYTVARNGVDTAGRTMPTRWVSARTRTITLSSLRPGRTYLVTIRAVNAAGTSVPYVVHLYG